LISQSLSLSLQYSGTTLLFSPCIRAGGSLTVAFSTFNKPAAWEMLKQITFSSYASYFSESWIRQWSAPDCVNSTLSDAPGQRAPGAIWEAVTVFCAAARLFQTQRAGQLTAGPLWRISMRG
jgi:hypothetical protein